MASDFFKKLQDIVIKFLPKRAVKDIPIKDDAEAAAVLAKLGRIQAQALRVKADMADKILAIQEEDGRAMSELEAEIQLMMTRLREYALSLGLDKGIEGAKTLMLTTGPLAFYDGQVVLSVSKQDEVITVIESDPELAAKYLVKPEPRVSIRKAELAKAPEAIAQINRILGEALLTRKRPVFFSAHPTSLDEVKEGIKIKGKVREEKVD